ncbi:zinc finger protein 692 [Cygnus olor]|uniref:zinc finger protein 692 n=1 Tax=Cygnus olor TaxID=8869 RepID=UPI001ADE5BCC|nr:zinc finger protein 692 [Cygnus olor]XP_040398694.1 zinc finger protein 692 [Cygnus olor]
MDPGRPGRQRAPDCVRRQKRRELDARRSKCRIRLGGHLEQWCRLKEQLGFALHSQLAKFLLDRYSSQGCVLSPGPNTPEPSLLHADALQRLVALSHGHGQECGFVPDVKPPASGSPAQLVWECVAGHSFSWGVPTVADGQQPWGVTEEDSGRSSPPVPGRRRSLRRAGLAAETKVDESSPRKDGAEPEVAAWSPAGDGNQREEAGESSDAAPRGQTETATTGPDHESTPVLEEKPEQGSVSQEEEEEEEDEDFVEEDDLAYTDDLRDENYHPSLDSDSELQRRQSQPKSRKKPVKEEQSLSEPSPIDSSPAEERGGRVSCKQRTRSCDEDVAQIGPKRIRKAAKREILLCDFEGCGKIFSNRQYLNHHKKYQHVHQKTFTCSEPSCGKSFNFKKHLKEHEKLHSDKRDYICEFCARSFRTSSNLIIHRRIHTGEKPLQCEICGFTCRQKASLNWHMKKHDADSFYQFSCDICGKKFEKRDNVTAHKSKSHPEAPSGPPQAVPSSPPSLLGTGMGHTEAPGAFAAEHVELPGGDGQGEEEKSEGHPPPIAASAE